MWIKVHRYSDDEEMLINVDKVVSIEPDNHGSLIGYGNGFGILVIEDYSELVMRIKNEKN